MIKDGEVVIVDEFTGRLMPGPALVGRPAPGGRGEGGVKIERENQTLATITFQNYFRMYDKLAGMTGTADTEAVEFDKIYKLEVFVIPTNRPMIRKENPDLVYMSEKEKFDASWRRSSSARSGDSPTLVGTVSIEKSERLSGLLKRRGVKHVVLNARYHAQEAEIVAQAGRLGTATIATNMAGRGTDILLGGNAEFLAARAPREGHRSGERAGGRRRAVMEESGARPRRSTRGSSSSGVCTSSAPSGTRRAASTTSCAAARDARGSGILALLPVARGRPDAHLRRRAAEGPDGAPEHRGGRTDRVALVSRSIERAQKQVEQRNFETRKHLLEYDDVMNKQRTEIYSLRRELLEGEDQKAYAMARASDTLDWLIDQHMGEKQPSEWALDEFRGQVLHYFGIDAGKEGIAVPGQGVEEIRERLTTLMETSYESKEKKIGVEMMRQQVKFIALNIIDARWKDHLLAMDHLKEGIGLRAYGQKDPLVEYKRESFDLFAEMKNRIEEEIIRYLFLFEPMTQEEREEEEASQGARAGDDLPGRVALEGGGRGAGADRAGPVVPRRTQRSVPCGSGKKYKKCHAVGA
jgi:preprotein translocase subunit SecA